MRIFAKIVIVICTFFSLILLCLYCFALADKIMRPEYKNISCQNYLVIGIILLVFVILNLYLLRHFFKKHKTE